MAHHVGVNIVCGMANTEVVFNISTQCFMKMIISSQVPLFQMRLQTLTQQLIVFQQQLSLGLSPEWPTLQRITQWCMAPTS